LNAFLCMVYTLIMNYFFCRIAEISITDFALQTMECSSMESIHVDALRQNQSQDTFDTTFRMIHALIVLHLVNDMAKILVTGYTLPILVCTLRTDC